MFKSKLLLLILPIIILFGCRKSDIEPDVPACIKNKIVDFKKPQALCDDAMVSEFEFKGKIVYVFYQGSCGADMTDDVIDAGCNYLGYLGGLTGNTTINGVDFYANATYLRIVWEK